MSQLKNSSFVAFLAPAIVPVVSIVWIIGSGEEVEDLNGVAVFWIAVVSYAGFFALGYPLAVLLDKRDYLSIGTLLVSGFTCGAIVFVLLGLAVRGIFGSYMAPTLEPVFVCGGLGALVAFIFGLLAKVRWSRDPFQDR